MKRYGWLLGLILLGCSTAPETVPETTSEPEVEDDGYSAWLQQVQKDGALLAQLNETAAAAATDSVALYDRCGDQDLADAMKARNYAPILDSKAKMSAVVDILKAIPDTGSKYRAAHLEEAESHLANLSDSSDVAAFAWQPEDAEALRKNLKSAGFDPKSLTYEEASAKLVGMLKGDDCAKTLQRYCTWVSDKNSAQAASAKDFAEANALLTCDLTQWARELRLNYPKNDYAYDRFRAFMGDKPIVAARVKGFVADVAKSGPEKAIARLTPPDEQYAKLIAARKIYLDAIEAGGWPKVDDVPKNLEAQIGKSYKWAPSLKQRLLAEGYSISDTESDIFDEETRSAVELYRNMHQLNTKKLVDQTLVKNMAVGPDKRLENIDLTIQRYRESAIGSLNYYVKVNVPDFHLEVWKDGQRIARHKIVVGNNNVEKDPETKKPVPDPETLYPLHPNRTPLQTSKINEVIYNPYWNVPSRIRQQELEPKLAENPNYYIENNYEEVNVGDPKLYYVRELPNPKNSLGKVKLMFPNPHNTYLHDTPAKAAFNNPTRALSHGCMRVQNPLDFAKLILTNDGQYDERKVNDILNADPLEETSIQLKHPVDVDVLYLNNRVDDSGVVGFLSDVYEYDAVRLGRVVLQKLPKPKDWK